MNHDSKIYRAYIEAKASKRTAKSVAVEFGISRRQLYDIVSRVAVGQVGKMNQCLEKSRLDCLWRYKYKARFQSIPKNRQGESVNALRKLIEDMNNDGFPVLQISKRIGKDRATVGHHLN